MNKITIISFLLLFLFYSSAMGQNSEPGKIRYSSGYGAGLIQVKEENLIPKVHRDVANFLDFCIEKKTGSYRLLQLQLGYGKLKTEIENEAVSFNGYCFCIMRDLKFYFFYDDPDFSIFQSVISRTDVSKLIPTR